MLRNSALPEDQNFNDLLNDHVSDFMLENQHLARAGDLHDTEHKQQDDFMHLM
jgi:hypothetical protein